jgi:hypothetical protein
MVRVDRELYRLIISATAAIASEKRIVAGRQQHLD